MPVNLLYYVVSTLLKRNRYTFISNISLLEIKRDAMKPAIWSSQIHKKLSDLWFRNLILLS